MDNTIENVNQNVSILRTSNGPEIKNKSIPNKSADVPSDSKKKDVPLQRNNSETKNSKKYNKAEDKNKDKNSDISSSSKKKDVTLRRSISETKTPNKNKNIKTQEDISTIETNTDNTIVQVDVKDKSIKRSKSDKYVKKSKSKNNWTKTANDVQNLRKFFSNLKSKKSDPEKKSTSTDSNNEPVARKRTNKELKKTESDAGSSTKRDTNLLNPPANDTSPSENVKIFTNIDPHAEEYFMRHPRRGKAVIFNHEKFDKMEPRDGTKVDVENLTTILEMLKFEIVVYHDKEVVDILDIVRQLAKEDHSDSDCIAFFVLTHGKIGGDVSAKDNFYPVDLLWGSFVPEKSPTLAGKPKLFFISACRGAKVDAGFRLFRGRTQTDSGKHQTFKLPNQADILLAYSTVDGQVSFRDTENGTWFIQSLCNVFKDHYESKDLLKMLTITSRKIAIDYRSVSDDEIENDLTQVPSITSMLIRDLYFR